MNTSRDRKQAEHAHTSSWVADILRERIANGQLLPGTQLSEQALADTLEVSRNTLREAFTMLTQESIVRRIPNRGVFVASPNADDIREIYRVRRHLEPAAVLWNSPESQTLDAMDEVIDRARQAQDAGDPAGMADANQDFHQLIVSLADSHMMSHLMNRVLAEMRLVFHAMAAMPDFHAWYVDPNAHLVSMLRAGEQHVAANTLIHYLDRAEAELLAHVL